MTPPQPPRLATWLLQRFGVRESVIGDVIERYQRRPSRGWYWRQVFLTIVANSLQEIRNHKLMALRAIFVGVVVVWLLRWAISPATIWLGKSAWNWTVENDLDTIRIMVFRPSRLILQFVIPSLYLLVSGWVVARAHRPRGMAMVFTFVAVLELHYFASMAWWYGLSSSAALYRPPVGDFLTINVTFILITALFPIVGGLLGAGHEGDADTRGHGMEELA